MLVPRGKQFYVILFFLILLIGFWSCELNYRDLITSPADLPPAIFAFVNTAADSQYVVITNSFPPEEEPSQSLETEYRRFRQAKVTIESHTEQFVYNNSYEIKRAFDKSRYFIFVSAHKVYPNETYKLRVEIPERGVFTATTTTPGDFNILAPNSVDTIDVFHPLQVQTSISQRAAGYRVTLWSYIVDSTDFKSGINNEVRPIWARAYRYFKASENPIGVMPHNLRYYYDHPEQRDIILLRLELSIEALDAAAWLSREIYADSTRARIGGNNSGEEFRLEPVAFSNIEGGRGVMSAVTTKVMTLRFPPMRKR